MADQLTKRPAPHQVRDVADIDAATPRALPRKRPLKHWTHSSLSISLTLVGPLVFDSGMTHVDLGELRWAVEALQWVKQRKAEIKELEDKARDAIEEALGADTVGVLDGQPVVTWKYSKRVSLDQKLLKRAYPDVDAACRVTTEVRRFVVLDD